jgi:hypothetical protein
LWCRGAEITVHAESVKIVCHFTGLSTVSTWPMALPLETTIASP